MDVDKFQELADNVLLGEALKLWIDACPGRSMPDLDAFKNFLALDIAKIDTLISDQLNEIIHHREFKTLEASWRGLALIVFQELSANVMIKMMHATWAEVHKDVGYVLEFDQSYLFKQIYSKEFGLPGGEPYGLIVCDYYARIQGDSAIKDIDTLKGLAAIGAAAFAPVIVGVHPQSLMMETFSEISPRINFNFTFKQNEYDHWHQLREDDNTRYLGLAFPNFLLREPFDNESQSYDFFYFREESYSLTGRDYLWGNASYAVASIILSSFTRTNWFTEMRDYNPQSHAGGFVRDAELFKAIQERSPFVAKFSTEVFLDNELEYSLSGLGFIPLRQVKHVGYPVLFSNKSVYKPKHYSKESASVNEEISSEIQYMLYASRFAHYIKVMLRDQVGAMRTATEISSFLNDWIQQYVSFNVLPGEDRLNYPLKGATVKVKTIPGMPGVFETVLYVQPHTFLEGVDVTINLTDETEHIKSYRSAGV